MSIKRDDIFKVLVGCLLSLLIWIGSGVLENQKDIARRLRIVELNQARIMERIGVKPFNPDTDILQHLSKNVQP